MTQTDSVVQEILALDQERLKAMTDADIEVLNRILSDDLSYVHTAAAVDTKESFTGALASRASLTTSPSSPATPP